MARDISFLCIGDYTPIAAGTDDEMRELAVVIQHFCDQAELKGYKGRPFNGDSEFGFVPEAFMRSETSEEFYEECIARYVDKNSTHK